MSTPNLCRAALGALCAAALTLLLPMGAARAQDYPSVNLQQFRPAPGPADYLTVFGTGVARHLDWNAGLYLNYANAPLRLSSMTNPEAQVVDFQSGADVIAVLGLYDFAEIGLVLPAIVSQDTEDPTPLVPGDPDAGIDSFALADPRLTTKFEILGLLDDGFGLALANVFYLPLGDTEAFSGDGSFGLEARLVGEYMLPFGGIRLAGNTGFRYRAEGRFIREAWIGNEILWGVGSIIPLWEERLDLILETNGAIAAGKGESTSVDETAIPAEFLGGLRIAVTPEWTLSTIYGRGLADGYGSPDHRVVIGIGRQWVSGGKWNWDYDFDGFVGEDDLCPREREDRDGFRDEDGCPDPDNDEDGIPDERDKCPDSGDDETAFAIGPDGCPDNDSDGDHVPNDRDKCPDDPEDYDRFEDEDGCPDIDNDNDDIFDVNDSCPDSAETYNGIADEDGCPEKENQKVIVTNQKIEILDKVYFQTGSARIQARSHAVLDEVAEVIRATSAIRKLRIEGHTDDQGGDRYNLRLSQKRAEAVRTYLIETGGVQGDRLVAVGYGEEQPIAPNNSAEGRGRNRRVDFVIIERTAGSGREALPDDDAFGSPKF